ncbi:MAG: hypothetical protein JEZ00_21600 [Anaerolineaceae bacterium]|nr:hypothetical protein [Anaerolineaceae bacterium]
MSESDKLIALVSKLMENTINNKIRWVASKPNESELNKYPADFFEVVYYLESKKRIFRLFERKYKLSVVDKIDIKHIIGSPLHWGTTTELDIYTDDYIPIVELTNLNILKDLLKVVKEQVFNSDIDNLINDFEDL